MTGHTRASQRVAVAKHRRRLRKRGISRYEVRGLAADKDLVRTLAMRLALDDAGAAGLRAEVARRVKDQRHRRGGVLAALRRSPLVGTELMVERDVTHGRELKL